MPFFRAVITPLGRRERRVVATFTVLGLASGLALLALSTWKRGDDLATVSPEAWVLAAFVGAAVPVLVTILRSVRQPTDAEADALIERAASGDQGAARELAARRDRAVAVLRQEAQTSRSAARKYRDHVTLEIEALRELERDFAARNDPDLVRQLQADIRHLQAELAWAVSQC